jgi:KDO2-lipid IV(A) lauroyltransferase
MSENPLTLRYLAPNYWPTWLLLAMMRLCGMLPYRMLLVCGQTAGSIAYYLMKYRRRIAQTNIDMCFPELKPSEREKICRFCFQSIGISIFETALAWWGNPEKLQSLCSIEGFEHIEQAQKENKAIILLSGHMCCTDIGARLLAFKLDFQAMYKPAKNKLFETVMRKCRSRSYYEMIPRKQSRRLLKNLKNKIATWYGPDQTFGREETVFAPFFGVPAITLTATARIARFADAAVIPFFPYRLNNGKGYKLVIGEPLNDFPSGDALTDAGRVNAAIEKAVRLAPEQYLWLHRRFRHRPTGETDIY